MSEAEIAEQHRQAAQAGEEATEWRNAVGEYEACLSIVGQLPGGAGQDEVALLTGLGRCYWNLAEARTAWRTLRRAISLAKELKLYEDPVEIACALSERELVDRREGTIAELLAGALDLRELDDGYELTFPGSGEWGRKLGEFIEFERDCCAFFTFELVFQPRQGQISLRLRGTGGVKDFVREMIGA